MKKGRIFALVINNTNGYEKIKSRCCSSVWLECLPVTQEVASSSLVSTAESLSFLRDFFVLYTPHIDTFIGSVLKIGGALKKLSK